MTAAISIDILEECLLESADTFYPDGWCLQLDNAPTHTARQAQQWLQDNGVTVLDWPANSPDLAPIENLWVFIKQCVEICRSQNVYKLEDAIQVEWQLLTPCDLSPYIERMSSRMRLCVDSGGILSKNERITQATDVHLCVQKSSEPTSIHNSSLLSRNMLARKWCASAHATRGHASKCKCVNSFDADCIMSCCLLFLYLISTACFSMDQHLYIFPAHQYPVVIC